LTKPIREARNYFVNNMAMLALSEKFVSQYLGGRYQESMKPEVATRLTEITVDPKTVQQPTPLATKQ
jgi:hypothetical protein